MATTEKPTVIIVGAGLGGLMLGALLEKSDVPYAIFERAAAVKPLGMHNTCTTTPIVSLCMEHKKRTKGCTRNHD